MVYYQEKESQVKFDQFEKAVEYDCKEPTLSMWKAKAEYDLKNHPEWNVEGDKEEDDDIDLVLGVENEYTQSMANTEKDKSHEPKIVELDANEESSEKKSNQESTSSAPAAQATTQAPKSTNVDVINKIAPLNVKFRDDWYQSNEEVIITIYAKKSMKKS